ncbi:zinc-binding dehydrogenase [Homoserinimonas sp. OAct 916]|uniref:zinc-binding dehydrogenase n=1 Tax=Homoserinimonas sp. OAct 916 TaxID=2211450 RepID=UPI00272A4E14|nr:zinc-binding dehydrogenase [Homoserinimonas sp. OAct 916]
MPGERGVRGEGVSHIADVRAELAQLMADIAPGKIRVELERVYRFDQTPDALAKLQSRRARGKVVLQLD